MQIFKISRYEINDQVKSAKPKQNKFKIFDAETGKMQNYIELFFSSTIEKIKIVVLINDRKNVQISKEEQEIKRGNKIARNGFWKYKLRFATPSNVELSQTKQLSFFLEINVFREDSGTLLGQFKFEKAFKFVTHYNQLPKRPESNTIQKTIKKREYKTKSTTTTKLEVARSNLANNRTFSEEDEEEELEDSRDMSESADEIMMEKNLDDLESTLQMNDLGFQQTEELDFSEVQIQISDSNMLDHQNECPLCNFDNICFCEVSFPTNVFEF